MSKKKAASKKKRSVTVRLTFSESDLDEILDAANFSTNSDSLRVKDLSVAQFNALKRELQDTGPNFVDEIVEGSRDACANDWLCDFSPQDEEDEDEDWE